MTQRRFIPSSALRLAQPHRPNSLVQSDAKSRAGNAQSFISRTDEGQSHSRSLWPTAFKPKIDAPTKAFRD